MRVVEQLALCAHSAPMSIRIDRAPRWCSVRVGCAIPGESAEDWCTSSSSSDALPYMVCRIGVSTLMESNAATPPIERVSACPGGAPGRIADDQIAITVDAPTGFLGQSLGVRPEADVTLLSP